MLSSTVLRPARNHLASAAGGRRRIRVCELTDRRRAGASAYHASEALTERNARRDHTISRRRSATTSASIRRGAAVVRGHQRADRQSAHPVNGGAGPEIRKGAVRQARDCSNQALDSGANGHADFVPLRLETLKETRVDNRIRSSALDGEGSMCRTLEIVATRESAIEWSQTGPKCCSRTCASCALDGAADGRSSWSATS